MIDAKTKTRQPPKALSQRQGSVRFSANSASRKFRMVDLFSGIGGFALAAKRTWGNDLEIVCFVEKDKYCQEVLRKNFRDVKIYEDIKNFDGTACGTVDLLTGGFPCQPYSVAGKRKGKDDDRALWPEMDRVISEAKPPWIIGENVAGIVNMELDNVCASLEGQGYEVQTFIIPACAVGAPHRRDRVWIVGWKNVNDSESRGCGFLHSDNIRKAEREIDSSTDTAKQGLQKPKESQISKPLFYAQRGNKQDVADTSNERLQGGKQADGSKGAQPNDKQLYGRNREWDRNWLEVATRLCRVDDGVSRRVDRLKSLGNAIVPQAVLPIMQAIKIINEAG